ncbi:dimethylaniline monooxygenase 1 [Grus japonensis]|uniref:Flavin-containing monooxygenase n=1 Tax=Grus japonensis TaxID=30415 RepID=A0ABC9X722_GRUJA
MRVAAVGAGVSGLTATKCCLEEGLEPTGFEQSRDIGGLWHYTEHVEAGRPSLCPSVISNTSKEMSVFPDFPYPEDFPVFLPDAQLLDYLWHYTERFGLQKHIKFGTTVVSIRKHPDFATTGQWDVVTETDGKQTSHVFDAVMVCSGNFSKPSLPPHGFPGIEKFQGQYFHSRRYKHPDVFQGKRVLVVGKGNSGVDIAVEASRVAAKSPSALRSRFVREPVLNDDLPSYILTGRITIKPGVKEFKDNSVVFHNCPEEEPIDNRRLLHRL